ncbi:MAG TPA: hypothetical protein VMN57_16740 [Anaerolineales bacterium]|nr:hypothetical protein [Anaerolineales bacterium]
MRYSKYRREQPSGERQTNPIWRGIGCILIIIAPIISFAIANEVMLSGVVQDYIYLPPILRSTVRLPMLGTPVPYFYGTLALSAAVLVGLFAAFFVIYSALYQILGPSPYGPTDVPPVRTRRKVRKSR